MSARWMVLAAMAVTFGTAWAAGGSGGGTTPNPGITEERRVQQDIGGSTLNPTREAEPGFQIDGTVTDGSGSPLGAVLVKMFSNGMLRASAQTAVDGSFRIEANPLIGGENSTVLWFQSPDPERLLDAQAILSEGKVAREKKLFPPCAQRVDVLGNHATVAVRLMTQDEMKAAVEQSKCLEGGSS